MLNFRTFHGAEDPLPLQTELHQVKKEVLICEEGQVAEENSDDSDIEMIGVVTSDKVKYKVIKVEELDDVKLSKKSCFSLPLKF